MSLVWFTDLKFLSERAANNERNFKSTTLPFCHRLHGRRCVWLDPVLPSGPRLPDPQTDADGYPLHQAETVCSAFLALALAGLPAVRLCFGQCRDALPGDVGDFRRRTPG